MNNNYWVSHFAERRQDELIRIPQYYAIHPDFTLFADENEIRTIFSQIHALYSKIYGDITESPEEFGMPLYEKGKYSWSSQQCRDAEQASFRPFVLLYNLFTCGEVHDYSLHVSIKKYKCIKSRPKCESKVDEKITNTHLLFKKLTDYGFLFEGLKNNKTTEKDIIVSYPENTLSLHIWKMLADKARNINQPVDFLSCRFRLLQDDMCTKSYGLLEDIADTFPTETEKMFIYKMDEALLSMGLFRCSKQLAYYRTENLMKQKGPFSFKMININRYNIWSSELKSEKLELWLRIRNVYNCMEYLESCPDSVKQIFTEKNDKGCGKHDDNSCKHGVSYEMNGQTYWRCGCCNPAFTFHPNTEDIPHYIKLVELGEKK